MLNFEWLFMYNNFWTLNLEPWTLNLEPWTFELSTFKLFTQKQTSRYIKFFHCFPKFDTRSDHYGTFLNFKCWILKDFSPYNNLLLNLEVFSDGWVIATKEQSYRSHSGKLEKPFIWLRFLGFIPLRSKWQRNWSRTINF